MVLREWMLSAQEFFSAVLGTEPGCPHVKSELYPLNYLSGLDK